MTVNSVEYCWKRNLNLSENKRRMIKIDTHQGGHFEVAIL